MDQQHHTTFSSSLQMDLGSNNQMEEKKDLGLENSTTPSSSISTTFQNGFPETTDKFLNIKLAFVNRNESANEVLKLLTKGTEAESLSDYTLPLILQHFGSGKTSFAKNLVPLWQSCKNGSWLPNAHYVYVDLRSQPRTFLRSSESPGQDASDVLLNITIDAVCNSLSETANHSEAVKDFNESACNWDTYFRVVKKHNLKLLLGFDEVDGLQADLSGNPVKGWPTGTDKKSRTQKVKTFLHFLAGLLAQDFHKSSVAIVVCGKSAELKAMTREPTVSPFNVHHVILPPFSLTDMKTLITESTVSTMTSTQVYQLEALIKHAGYDVDEFCKALLIYTGGIPRPVALTLSALVDKYQTLPPTITDFFHTLAYHNQKHHDLALNPDSPFLYTCIYLAKYEMGVPLYYTITTPAGTLEVYEMIEQTKMYYYNTPSQEAGDGVSTVVKLRIPKFTLMYFGTLSGQVNLVNELSNLKIHYDEGGFFEYVWLVKLATHQIQAAARNARWSSLPGKMFEHTFCNNEIVQRLRSGFFQQVPAMGNASATSMSSAQASNQSFLSLLDQFVDDGNKFLIPAPTSTSQALTFALSKKRIICYQLMLLHDGKLSASMIKEEVDKVATLVNGLDDVALMIVGTGYALEVTDLIGANQTLLLQRNQEHKVGGTSIKLPANMDVVLVSEASLKLFLRGDALATLKSVKVNHARLLQKEELSLICSSLAVPSRPPEEDEVLQFLNEISPCDKETHEQAAQILVSNGYTSRSILQAARPQYLLQLGVAAAVVDFIGQYQQKQNTKP